MNKTLCTVFLGVFVAASGATASADERGSFQIRPHLGVSKGEQDYPAADYVSRDLVSGEVRESGTSVLSPGGGFTAGLDLGYQFSPSVMISAGYMYRLNQEMPNISDLSVSFTQQEVHAAVLYTQSINKRIRWFVGPGFAYRISPRYKYEYQDTTYEYVYEDVISPTLELGGEVMTDEGMALNIGMRFHITDYTGKDVFENGERVSGVVPVTYNGNGVDLSVSATWYFGGK